MPSISPIRGGETTDEEEREYALKNNRLCPWCYGWLRLVSTQSGDPIFICADEFKPCGWTGPAHWVDPRIKATYGRKIAEGIRWLPDDFGKPSRR